MKLNKFTFLPLLALLIGVFFLGLGIYETATSQTKGYAETVGYYNYSTIAEKEHYDSIKKKHYATTYYLTYQYAVDGEAYYVTSDYTTSIEPSFGEEIKVLYDTENPEKAEKFLNEIDAAAVYVNASTRFTDGFEFGFGAEIGISTQKMHARGPMGLEQLTSIKYVVKGNGQVR